MVHTNLYQRFQNSSLDASGLGLAQGPATSDNVFTPLRAEVIAWTPSGGHFCFVDGFDQTVFYVDPGAQPGQCVCPVARSFSDLLSLVVACKGTSLVCSASLWSKLRFEGALQEMTLTPKQTTILRAIQNGYHPPEIADPYDYIQQLQAEVDVSYLDFRDDYAQWSPLRPGDDSFYVSYGNRPIWEKSPFKTYSQGKTMRISGKSLHIPAVYACQEGIVIDLVSKIEADDVKRYLEKWEQMDHSEISKAMRLLREAEDPYLWDLSVHLSTSNGKFSPISVKTITWNPYSDNAYEVYPLLKQYRCSREAGWSFLRLSFPYKLRKKYPLKGLKLSLTENDTFVPGGTFAAGAAGDTISLTDPVTQRDYQLQIDSYSAEELDPNFLYDGPRHYVEMTYTLTPPLSPGDYIICDCAESDPFRCTDESDAVCLGSAEFSGLVPDAQASPLTAISARHYSPVGSVRWLILFHRQTPGSAAISLM